MYKLKDESICHKYSLLVNYKLYSVHIGDTNSSFPQSVNYSTCNNWIPITCCYGLNCVLPEFMCWSLNPQFFRMWLYLEITSLLSEKEVIRVGSIWYYRFPYKQGKLENRIIHTGRILCEHEDGQLQAKEKDLEQIDQFLCFKHLFWGDGENARSWQRQRNKTDKVKGSRNG